MSSQKKKSILEQTVETIRTKGWEGALNVLVCDYRNGQIAIGPFVKVAAGLMDSALDLAKQNKASSATSLAQAASGILREVILDKTQPQKIYEEAVRYQTLCLGFISSLNERKPNMAASSFAENINKSKANSSENPYARCPGEKSWTDHLRNFSKTRTTAKPNPSHTAQSAPQPKSTSAAERPKASSPYFGQAPESVAPACAKAASKPDPRMAKWVNAHTFANTAVSEPSLYGVG